MNRSLAVVLPFLALIVPAATIAAGIFFITTIAPFLIGGQKFKAPEEPLLFPHNVHVQVVGMECAFCHRSAAKSFSAGYPDVEQCMFCHSVVAPGSPGIETVRTAWTNQQPITWERIHRMPDHVHFSHEAHIKSNVPCSTCHGEVKEMGQVVQVRMLNMGDCVECHRQNNAPTECVACHY